MKKIVLCILCTLLCLPALAQSDANQTLPPLSHGESGADAEMAEVKEILEGLWKAADAFVLDNAESFITVIRSACHIPEGAEVECALGEKRSISAGEVEAERQALIAVSEEDLAGIPDGLSGFTGSDAYRLMPGYYGTMAYKFAWSEADATGELRSHCKVIEQLYALNLTPGTVKESLVISYFIEREGDASSTSNAPASLPTQLPR